MKNETEQRMTLRVSAVHRERYCLYNGTDEIYAKLKGSLIGQLESYPVVGDYVTIKYNSYGDSVIEQLKPRKTYFVRPDRSGHAAGFVKTMKEEVLAANYDYAFIVTSLNQNYNLNRIIRYVSIVLQGGGKPIVILTKEDLCDNPQTYVKEIQEMTEEVSVYTVSAKQGTGIDALLPYLKEGNTILLLGSSGVGKSTLVNRLAGSDIMKVNDIRDEDGKGRHTTTHRQSIVLPSGATIIDTPGMREIGVMDVEEGVNDTFTDIAQLVQSCKFSNCRHQSEPGCAVKIAIEEGRLTKERFELYQNLQMENAWSVGLSKPIVRKKAAVMRNRVR